MFPPMMMHADSEISFKSSGGFNRTRILSRHPVEKSTDTTADNCVNVVAPTKSADTARLP